MRFFSNENRESDDESSTVDVQNRAEQVNADQAHDDHPERVQSDPVSVPQQRSGSPWSDTPAAPGDTSDAELADQERADGTAEATGQAGDHRDLPGSQPSGATPVDPGAFGTDASDGVADHDTHGHDGPGHGRHEDPVDLPLDDTDARATDDSATTTTYRPDGTVTTGESGSEPVRDADPALRDEGGFDDPLAVEPTTDQPLDGDPVDADRADAGPVNADRIDADPALQDEGDFDDPRAVDPVTDRPLDGDTADGTATTDTDTALKDEGDFSDPQAVDPVTDRPLDGEDSGVSESGVSDSPVTDSASPVVPIPVPVGSDATATPDATPATAGTTTSGDQLPGSVVEPDLSKIFAAADAQSFQERWRDVQLRFVDSPKDATTEAASLLDEVVDKLAGSLRAQKDSLSADTSDDTERLRVELRGYRELFNRVIGL